MKRKNTKKLERTVGDSGGEGDDKKTMTGLTR